MSKKLVIILINFVVILVVTMLLINQVNEYKGLTEVYVAKTSIKKGVKITPDMVELKKITLNHEGSSLKSQTDELVTYYDDMITDEKNVIGKYATYDFVRGEVILEDKLSEQISENSGYLYNLPKGYYAYVIKNTIDGGIVKINDYVDLYIYTKDQGLIEEPALRHLRVQDIRTKDGNQVAENTETVDETTDEATDGANTKGEYLVVALNDYQLKKLVGYEVTKADIKAAVRRRPNSENEIINNPEVIYPYFSVADGILIDEATEQQMIDDNAQKIADEQNNQEKSNENKEETKNN